MSPVRHPTEPSEADGGRSDAALLADHVAGDVYAFEYLIRRHERRLWAVALRTCRDPGEAQDAIQTALLSAHRAAASFQGRSAVSTWLHRIVVNACLNRLRCRPTVGLPDHDAVVPLWGTPPDATTQVDDRLQLQHALDRLPQKQRVAVLLVDVEGYSVAETAALLGVAPGTVKSRCSRARTALAEALRDADARDVEPTSTTARRTS